ncbi:MAG: YbaN family protein [Pseudomonadota bacterium]
MNRIAYLCIGWIFVALGAVGVVLPLLPTTPFLLVAVAAFMKSSPRFAHWLQSHRVFGPYLEEWTKNRAVPLSAKVLAVTTMSASFAWLALYSSAPPVAVALTGIVLATVATWLVTRPTARGR